MAGEDCGPFCFVKKDLTLPLRKLYQGRPISLFFARIFSEAWMEPDTLALVRFCIDMACVAAFALSGVLAARDRKAELDLFGVVVVAVVTAIGGGTLRDVLLDVPVFWLKDTTFIYCPIIAGLLGFVFT